jgi:hypothetical protein
MTPTSAQCLDERVTGERLRRRCPCHEQQEENGQHADGTRHLEPRS